MKTKTPWDRLWVEDEKTGWTLAGEIGVATVALSILALILAVL